MLSSSTQLEYSRYKNLQFCRYASIRSIVLGFTATFFAAFDIPVFWPILVMYWCVLFFVTMKKQILHMMKHRYVPFSWGKKVEQECFVRVDLVEVVSIPHNLVFFMVRVQTYNGKGPRKDSK